MIQTPKSLTLHIGIFGRTNVGKSTLVNYITEQKTSIVSSVPGTTTDSVFKTMELLPIGPITLIDTAGLDDKSILAKERIEKTNHIFTMADVAVIVADPNVWTEYETNLIAELKSRRTPIMILVNNYKNMELNKEFIEEIAKYKYQISPLAKGQRDSFLNEFKKIIFNITPEEILNNLPLTDVIIKKFQTVVLVVPIDLGAPKGRLILPEVQMIRAILDVSAIALIVKDTELERCLNNFKTPPDLVICDSQVIQKVNEIVPKNIKVTTFSIVFTTNRADIIEMLKGVEKLKSLKPGDKILIAEACTHHASPVDIGRVKIPNLVKKYLGFDVHFDVTAGHEYPKNIKDYALVIHCGGCMINKKQMISRMNYAVDNEVPITNYGIVLSFVNGVLERVIEPFKSLI
ncbi:MAG: [FeFe] hydrogenase H-cluster maturation GTPase HydF [Endomicrobiaceae bacterium]|nr:[FeFe] hydrogenase H-cluster maturation GTPase HydF [Endomicrobiaceae bacterium]